MVDQVIPEPQTVAVSPLAGQGAVQDRVADPPAGIVTFQTPPVGSGTVAWIGLVVAVRVNVIEMPAGAEMCMMSHPGDVGDGVPPSKRAAFSAGADVSSVISCCHTVVASEGVHLKLPPE